MVYPPHHPTYLRTYSNSLAHLQSLRIVPKKAYPTSTSSGPGAPSAPGIHDTLRTNLGLSAPADTSSSTGTVNVQSTHQLENRLVQWRSTQDSLKLETLRRQFGLAEPLRRGMELSITRSGEWRTALLGGSEGVHSDILAGRDAELDWEDVFHGALRPLLCVFSDQWADP